jgi:Effector-associated domain 11
MQEDNQQVIQSAKSYIAQGQLNMAFEVLKPLKWRNVELLESRYNATRQREIKNTIAFGDAQLEYSKITDLLLAALDHGQSTDGNAVVSNKTKIAIVLLSISLALGAWLFIRLYTPNNEKQTNSAKTDEKCPNFQADKAMKVLVLPFTNIGEASEQKPAIAVMNGIVEKTRNRQLPVQVGLYNQQNDGMTPEVAADIGKNCSADLVIHGTFAAYSRDSIGIRVFYSFLRDGEQGGSSGAVTLPNVMAMGNLRSVDDVVFSICARIAAQTGRLDVAKAWLDKIKQPDERTETPIRNRIRQNLPERIEERIEARQNLLKK